MANNEILFSEDEHKYSVDGMQIPSVTEIVNEIVKGEGAIEPNYYMDRGSRVHSAIKDIIENSIPEIEEDIAGFIDSFTSWLSQLKDKIVYCEQHMYHNEYKFCGTPDLVTTDKDGNYTVWDFKTGSYHKTYDLQTAGYGLLVAGDKKVDIKTISRRLLLLDKNGKKARVTKCDSPSDYDLFISACKLYHWKRENNIKPPVSMNVGEDTVSIL